MPLYFRPAVRLDEHQQTPAVLERAAGDAPGGTIRTQRVEDMPPIIFAVGIGDRVSDLLCDFPSFRGGRKQILGTGFPGYAFNLLFRVTHDDDLAADRLVGGIGGHAVGLRFGGDSHLPHSLDVPAQRATLGNQYPERAAPLGG